MYILLHFLLLKLFPTFPTKIIRSCSMRKRKKCWESSPAIKKEREKKKTNSESFNKIALNVPQKYNIISCHKGGRNWNLGYIFPT